MSVPALCGFLLVFSNCFSTSCAQSHGDMVTAGGEMSGEADSHLSSRSDAAQVREGPLRSPGAVSC